MAVTRFLVLYNGTKIAYPKDMPLYKHGTQLTLNDSGTLCIGMTGEVFICVVEVIPYDPIT